MHDAARSSIYKVFKNLENQETIKLIEKTEKDKLSAIETAKDKVLAEGLEKGKKEYLAEEDHRKAMETY